jgi:class 3 adenylate cyclase
MTAAVPQTVLFADVADSSALYGELGDERAATAVAACVALLSEVGERHSGVVRKRVGDEVLCTFPTADAAGAAACEMQRAVGSVDVPRVGLRRMSIRVGFAHGVVREMDGELFGDTIYRAHRLVERATGGRILIDEMTLVALGPEMRAIAQAVERLHLKGRPQPVGVYRLLWDREASTVPGGFGGGAVRCVEAVEIGHGKDRWRVDRAKPSLRIGTAPECDVRVQGAAVSKQHAVVRIERGRAWIEDVSTNGTLVRGPVDERTIRMETLELDGSGTFQLGSPDGARGAVVSWRCVLGWTEPDASLATDTADGT